MDIQCSRRFTQPVLIAVACALGGIAFLAAISAAFGKPQPHTSANAVVLAICAAVAIGMMGVIGSTKLLRSPGSRWSAFLSLGWPMITMAVVVAALALIFSDGNTAGNVSVSLVWFVSGVALTALFEEALFRGTVLPLLAASSMSVGAVVLTSATLFAVAHLLALFGGGPILLVGTLTQVIYTFCMGILLAVIVLKTANLWVAVGLHFVFNILGDITAVVNGVPQEAAPAGDLSLPVAMVMIVLAVPMAVVGWRALPQAAS